QYSIYKVSCALLPSSLSTSSSSSLSLLRPSTTVKKMTKTKTHLKAKSSTSNGERKPSVKCSRLEQCLEESRSALLSMASPRTTGASANSSKSMAN
ncbi:unnamed protein product, partial [Aphanomyces euteiches]